VGWIKQHWIGFGILVIIWSVAIVLAVGFLNYQVLSIHRSFDLEAGVVCWSQNGNMTCLPINQTQFSGRRKDVFPNMDF
jgi:hypothetical protein